MSENEEKTCPRCESKDIQTISKEAAVISDSTSGGTFGLFAGLAGGAIKKLRGQDTTKTGTVQLVHYVCRDCGKEFRD
jgi:DNA-directed RNA polymerase subunit RPC12/RpoP